MPRVRARGRLLDVYWRHRFHSFGRNSIIYKPIWVGGAHKMSVGEETVILSSWLSVEEPAWGRPDPALMIGDRVAVRPFCTISAAESVIIEDNVGISGYSLISDSYVELLGAPDRVKRPLATAPIHIGYGAGIGERVAVLPGATIGRHAGIGANSVVEGHIPDYAFAVGVPARPVGRTREPDGRR